MPTPLSPLTNANLTRPTESDIYYNPCRFITRIYYPSSVTCISSLFYSPHHIFPLLPLFRLRPYCTVSLSSSSLLSLLPPPPHSLSFTSY